MKKLSLFLTILFLVKSLSAQEIYNLPDNITTKWASPENWKAEKGKGGMKRAGRKGSASFRLKAGAVQVLAEETGSSGIVHRIWMTMLPRSPKVLSSVFIEMFWDGDLKPAVNVPIGDFFCQGLGEMVSFESDFFSSPEGKSFNCFVPMPFMKGMKIQLRNSMDADVDMIFYDVDYTVGDKQGKNMSYFHAFYNHQPQTTIKKDFEILPKTLGKGRFLGVNFAVRVNMKDYKASWWGEGEVKMYIDGDTDYPSLCGTGTEDYIGTGFHQGVFSHRYQGCPFADNKEMLYTFYRYHIIDPVYFYKDIKVTIQQIGFTTGKKIMEDIAALGKPLIKASDKEEYIDFTVNNQSIMFERSDDVATCAFYYLSRPSL